MFHGIIFPLRVCVLLGCPDLFPANAINTIVRLEKWVLYPKSSWLIFLFFFIKESLNPRRFELHSSHCLPAGSRSQREHRIVCQEYLLNKVSCECFYINKPRVSYVKMYLEVSRNKADPIKHLCVNLWISMIVQTSGTQEYQSLRWQNFGHLSTLNPSGWTTPPGMTTMSVTSPQPVKSEMVTIFVHHTSNGFSCFKLTRCTHIQTVVPK